jgi:hypothetical protein
LIIEKVKKIVGEHYYLMVTIVGQEHNTRGKQGATVLDWLTEEVQHTNFC